MILQFCDSRTHLETLSALAIPPGHKKPQPLQGGRTRLPLRSPRAASQPDGKQLYSMALTLRNVSEVVIEHFCQSMLLLWMNFSAKVVKPVRGTPRNQEMPTWAEGPGSQFRAGGPRAVSCCSFVLLCGICHPAAHRERACTS